MTRAYTYGEGFDQAGKPICAWDNPRMKRMERLLDFRRRHDVEVILGEWDDPASPEDRQDHFVNRYDSAGRTKPFVMGEIGLVSGLQEDGTVHWSLTVVNDADQPRTVTIEVPDVTWKSTVRRSHYFRDDRPVDGDGFPVPKAVESAVDLAAGITFALPSRGVIVATTIPIDGE